MFIKCCYVLPQKLFIIRGHGIIIFYRYYEVKNIEFVLYFIDIMRLRILSLMLGSQVDENMLLEIVEFVTITIVF